MRQAKSLSNKDSLLMNSLEKRFRKNPLHRAWMRHNKGSVRHYVLVGYDFPYFLACQAEWHFNYDDFSQGVEADELSEAPKLPQCKRCLKTNEYLLHDKARVQTGQTRND